MRYVIYSLIFLLIIFTACSDEQSEDTTLPMYNILPGALTEKPRTYENKSYSIDFNGARTGRFAIIYSGVVNNINYVGIAVSYDPSNDPSSDNFNLKIYFEAAAIPASIDLTTDLIAGDATIKVSDNTNTYTYESGNLTLTITAQDNETYLITSSGSAILSNSNTLTNINITALKVGSGT